MKYNIYLGAFLMAVAFMGAGCLTGGSNTVSDGQTLPDHITTIEATTLPQAILEARARSKSSVTITDTNQNIVQINITSPTNTDFTMTSPVGIDDPIAYMADYGVDLSRAYDVSNEDGLFRFSVSIVRHDDLATMMYELSTRLHQLKTTQDWVIDLR